MYICIIGMLFPSLAATSCLKPPPTLGWGFENLFYAMVLCRSITRPGWENARLRAIRVKERVMCNERGREKNKEWDCLNGRKRGLYRQSIYIRMYTCTVGMYFSHAVTGCFKPPPILWSVGENPFTWGFYRDL